MTKFIDSLDSDTKSTPAKIEAAFKKTCKSTKKDDNRFVSFICHIIFNVYYVHADVYI